MRLILRCLAALSIAAAGAPVLGSPQIVSQTSVGVTNSLRTFEQNGARYIARDGQGRIHLAYTDGTDLWYVRGQQAFDGSVTFDPPERINDGGTTVYVSLFAGLPRSRAVRLAVSEEPTGTIVHFVWRDVNQRTRYRRLSEDGGGWTWGAITNTTMSTIARLPAMVVDSTGRVHVVAEQSWAGDNTGIRYATSADGVVWSEWEAENRSATNSSNYRLPSLAVDQQDRVHMVFQAEGYQGNGPNSGATWWAPRYMVLDGGVWIGQVNPLGFFYEWGPPPVNRDVLFAYCNLTIDDQNNLHLSWHGTARSGLFAKDDAFYVARYYNPGADSWGAWTDLTTLHRRIHDDVPGGPIVAGGEDSYYTWVPSVVTDSQTDELYILMMFGLFDDEIGPSDISVGTDVGMVFFDGGDWQLDLIDLTGTPTTQRDWFCNSTGRLYLHANGRRYLDALWISGVHDPNDIWATNYDVVCTVLDMGPPNPGDLDGDGDVDLDDFALFAGALSGPGVQTSMPAADLDGDGDCDLGDFALMQERIANWP